jgi:hypothetical protein
MLRWLLHEGADVHQRDNFGATALIEAVEHDDLECVQILLYAGADFEVDHNGTAMSRAHSRDIILRLLEAGADAAHISYAGQRVLLGLPSISEEPLSAVSAEDFQQTFTRSFGKTNPERMDVPFWKAMVRSGVSAYEARRRFGATYDAPAKPVWCAQRYGQSLTLLPDGRAVLIGGEHEDGYDPDFCIYNDVFVYECDRSVTIYGYPESVFQPTDFHTATLMGDFIFVIGALGYRTARRYDQTPVYRLNVNTLRIERLDAGGEAPGWIYGHRAQAVDDHAIRIWDGRVLVAGDSGESEETNLECFVFDLNRLLWRRATVPREGPPRPEQQ